MRSRNSELAYCWYICLGCFSFTSCHANGVLSNNLTNLYPFPPIQFFMNALREKGIWVVFMLIGNVTYQWFPLGQYQILEICNRCGGTPVDMIPHSTGPCFYCIASLFFAGGKHFLDYGFCNVPLIKKMLYSRMRFPYPFSNTSVAIRDKNGDCQARNGHQKVKASLTTI